MTDEPNRQWVVWLIVWATCLRCLSCLSPSDARMSTGRDTHPQWCDRRTFTLPGSFVGIIRYKGLRSSSCCQRIVRRTLISGVFWRRGGGVYPSTSFHRLGLIHDQVLVNLFVFLFFFVAWRCKVGWKVGTVVQVILYLHLSFFFFFFSPSNNTLGVNVGTQDSPR